MYFFIQWLLHRALCQTPQHIELNNQLKDSFNIAVSNRYECLLVEEPSVTADAKHTNFLKAFDETVKKLIPSKPKVRQRAPWAPWETLSVRNVWLRNKNTNKNKNHSKKNLRKLANTRKELKESYESEQMRYLQKQIVSTNSASDSQQSAVVWRIVNEIRGEYHPIKTQRMNWGWKTQWVEAAFWESFGKIPNHHRGRSQNDNRSRAFNQNRLIHHVEDNPKDQEWKSTCPRWNTSWTLEKRPI